MSEVWVIESGEYEQRGIDAVAESPEAALVYLKSAYAQPYIVKWDELEPDSFEGFEVTGHFESVQGFSCKHSCTYTFTKYYLQPQPKPEQPEQSK